MRILIVTKDKGAFNAVKGIVPALRARGNAVQVVAEGLSMELWQKSGETLRFAGSIDFTKEPDDADVGKLFMDIDPHVLVVTGSEPINLERRFAGAAVTNGVPIVAVEDAVGAATRLGVVPNLVLTLNKLAVTFYDTHKVLPGVPKVAVGSDYFKRVNLSAEKQAEVDQLRAHHDALVCYAGQGGVYTTDILAMAIACIKASPSVHAGLIVRHHPKKLPDDVASQIQKDLAALEAERPGIIVNSSLTSEEAASVCDVTFSCFGSAMNVSAVHGHIPACVLTSATTAALKKQSGFDELPLVAVSAALACREPMPLKKLLGEREKLTGQGIFAAVNPFDADKAIDAIEKLRG